MNENIAVRLEALKLVKEWSTGLIVVQTGAVAVLGALLQRPPSGWFLCLVSLLFLSLISSIWVGAVAVVGTIPAIVQRLPNNPQIDIYEQKGGIGRYTLGFQCMLQERLFVLSLILFAITLIARPSQGPNTVIIEKPVQVEVLPGKQTNNPVSQNHR